MKRQAQLGYLLIEFAIALALAGIALTYQVRQKAHDLVSQFGTAQGQQLSTLGSAANAYAVTYYNQILNNTAVTGVATTRAPTVAELRTLGLLPSGFSTTAYNGSGYTISFSLSPGGCVLPNCSITGYAILNSAYLINGAYNPGATGSALLAMGADGGASTISGATISGINGGWSMANPVAGQPQGVLAMRLGSQAVAFSQFLRRDGTLPMTGALQMGNNQITGLLSVVAGATACTTKGDIAQDSTTGAPSYCDGSKYQSVGGGANWVATFGALPACNAGAKGQIYVVITPSVGSGTRAYACDGAGTWGAMAVNDSGNLTVAGTLTAGTATVTGNLSANTVLPTLTAADNTSCAGYTEGTMARSTVTSGLILSCQSGRWYRDPATQCAAGQTWSGGACRSISTYASPNFWWSSSCYQTSWGNAQTMCPNTTYWSGGNLCRPSGIWSTGDPFFTCYYTCCPG